VPGKGNAVPEGFRDVGDADPNTPTLRQKCADGEVTIYLLDHGFMLLIDPTQQAHRYYGVIPMETVLRLARPPESRDEGDLLRKDRNSRVVPERAELTSRPEAPGQPTDD